MTNYSCEYQFPDPTLIDPKGEGLIAFGGDLAPNTLRYAYAHGMFPWFNDGEPIAWWSPEPRCIIYPDKFSPSKSLKRRIKTCGWQVSINQDFLAVIQACTDSRSYSHETWINQAMIDAYYKLYQLGDAVSIEVWQENQLIGGLYGLKLGQAFFGESMFHRQTDASKVAFFVLMKLCQLSKFQWVDCQLPNNHLLNLGATIIPRQQFLTELKLNIQKQSCDWSTLFNQKFNVKQLLTESPILYQSHQLYI